ncbi:hypothetical protein BGZ80_003512, partial [Entomortierella chlamydospora]
MDGVETGSERGPQKVVSIVAEDGASNVTDESEPEFKLVERRRRHMMMIPVAALGPHKLKLTDMISKIKTLLAKKANIIGTPRLERLTGADDNTEPHIIFEVGSSDQVTALCQSGLQHEDKNGKQCETLFKEFTPTIIATQQNRIVRINAIAWTTKSEDVHAAMSKWGDVTSVTMGHNAKESMKTAKVTFAKAKSVEDMITQNVTCVHFGSDSGAVTQLGNKPITINRDLTMKLANLPMGMSPLDVLELFATIKAPNAESSFNSVSMPVNPLTKRRYPEA